MKYFDIYEDTLKEVSESGQGLWKNDLYIDLERTQKYGHYGQYFALWVELTSYKPGRNWITLSTAYTPMCGAYWPRPRIKWYSA